MVVANNAVIQEPNDDDQWQEYYDHDDEETLSLCDLPLYSGSFESNDYQCSVLDDDDQDLFEFISGDLSASSPKNSSSPTYAYADNLFFCGKLIPYQVPPVCEAPHKPLQIKTDTENQPQQQLFKKKKTFFQWRSSKKTSRNGKPIITNNVQKQQGHYEDHAKISVDSKALMTLSTSSNKGNIGNNKKHGYPVKKVSILTSPSKSRWPLFWGFARVQAEMELSDIRNRQRRRRQSPSSSPTSFTSFHDDDDESKVMKNGKSRSSGKGGLWSVLSVLGRGNSHARTIAKASVGCFRML